MEMLFNAEEAQHVYVPLVPGLNATVNSLIDPCVESRNMFERTLVSGHIKGVVRVVIS